MADRDSKVPRLRALILRFDEQQRQDFLEELRQFLYQQGALRPQQSRKPKRSKTGAQVDAATQMDFDPGSLVLKSSTENVAQASPSTNQAQKIDHGDTVSSARSSKGLHRPQSDAQGGASSAHDQRTHRPRSRFPLLEELLSQTRSLPPAEDR